ncbi:cation transporter [Phaeovulum veldkampii]|uniref:cation transporter n=1 Tax=Phaeovulum veldkampii TaxID=33049 RepID=UPI001F2FEEA1|nr:cation transporter [Phaeovulum veldkampii]
MQGIFLLCLGLCALGDSARQAFHHLPTEAGLMGGFALGGLVVNLASALVLMPHQTGDANIRAVGLFSRNDAIGNVIVVVAAALVAVTGSAWPDLVVRWRWQGCFCRRFG